eukprot:192270_1
MKEKMHMDLILLTFILLIFVQYTTCTDIFKIGISAMVILADNEQKNLSTSLQELVAVYTMDYEANTTDTVAEEYWIRTMDIIKVVDVKEYYVYGAEANKNSGFRINVVNHAFNDKYNDIVDYDSLQRAHRDKYDDNACILDNYTKLHTISLETDKLNAVFVSKQEINGGCMYNALCLETCTSSTRTPSPTHNASSTCNPLATHSPSPTRASTVRVQGSELVTLIGIALYLLINQFICHQNHHMLYHLFSAMFFGIFMNIVKGKDIMELIIPSDGNDMDKFGEHSVSIWNQTIAIGAVMDADKGSGSGSVYIYERRPNGTWNENKLVAEDGIAYDNFGYSVAVFENTILVGSPNNDHQGLDSGSVYIYEKYQNTNKWNLTIKLSVGQSGDFFGSSVGLHGDNAVIGAYYNDDKALYSAGAAYIFEKKNDTLWIEKAKLYGSDIDAGDWFGISVSIYGRFAIIGAYGHNNNNGAAYIFEKLHNGSWIESAKLQSANTNLFGTSVDIYGDYAAIGSSGNGAVYIFSRDISTSLWEEIQKLEPNEWDVSINNEFGWDVSINNDYIAVASNGPTFIFTRMSNSSYIQTAKILANNGGLSESVSVYDEYILIGIDPESAYLLTSYSSCDDVWKKAIDTETTVNTDDRYLVDYSWTICNEPTQRPTVSPTKSPSIPPTAAPTIGPTKTPSNAPTGSPTRTPTIKDAYSSYIEGKYGLNALSDKDIDLFADNIYSVSQDIDRIIEYGFTNHLSSSDGWSLQYKEYWVKTVEINEQKMSDLSRNNKMFYSSLYSQEYQIVLDARIECEQFICDYIISKYDKTLFTDIVTSELQIYFDNIGNSNVATDKLEFSVISGFKQVKSKYPDDIKETEWILIIMAIILSFGCVISILAYLWNTECCGRGYPKIAGFHIVDDSQYFVVLIFALQCWDFTSDLYLSIEICTQNDLENHLILISGIGCILFILIPYSVNLFYASRIKSILSQNAAAKSYFDSNSCLFTSLVVMSGGCYSAMSLVSSNIFGLNITSSGLTQYELRGLSYIKVFGTVILENVPQLICQLLYAFSINEISQAVAISFFASGLSVIGSTLTYMINRDTMDVKPVHYYLSIEYCKTKPCSVSQNSSGINAEEKQKIIDNKGRRYALTVELTKLFRIQSQSIQIGSTMITQSGATIHCLQLISQNSLNNISINENQHDMNVSPHFFVKQQYELHGEAVTEIFRTHFGLNNDFAVRFHFNLQSSSYDTNDRMNNKYMSRDAAMMTDIINNNAIELSSLSFEKDVNKMSDGNQPENGRNENEKQVVENIETAVRYYFNEYGANLAEQQILQKVIECVNNVRNNDPSIINRSALSQNMKENLDT